MKLCVLAAVGIVMGMAVPALSQEKAGTCTGPQNACQELLAVPRAYVAGYNKKDAAAVAALYTQDAIVVSEGPMQSGRDAIEKGLVGGLKAGLSNLVINVDQAHIAGNMAWAVGSYELTVPGKDQTAQVVPGNWGAVYAQDGGAWKIRMLTFNAIENRQR